MKVAIVGATGLVGGVMLKVLEERNISISELLLVASEKSVGTKISFRGKEISVISMQEAIAQKPDFALFSAGGQTSLEFAPQFAAVGTTVIDNSSAWRMDAAVPLIVPEVNGDILTSDNKIIANPNCSTVQMVLVLNSLHLKYGIKRIVVSTYQSVSGTGKEAVEQLFDERKGLPFTPKAYAHPIDLNLIPHIDAFLENDYTKEEMKMVLETQKIMRDNQIRVTATTVRVPVVGGHSESVNIEFHNEFELAEVKQILAQTPGVIVQDNTAEKLYPMPLFAEGKDDVFVGRIRRDESQAKSLNLWIVADNLRKGAATNTVQIMEYLMNK